MAASHRAANLPVHAFGADQMHGHISGGKAAQDAQRRAAQSMAQLQGFDLIQATAEADEHDRDRRLAKHDHRLQKQLGNFYLRRVDQQTGQGRVDERQAKNFRPVAAAVQDINPERVL